MKKDTNNSKRYVALTSFLVLLLLITVVATTYAIVQFSKVGTKENTISSGTVTMVYTEGTAIAIDNALPLSDEQGMALTGAGNTFQFTVATTMKGTLPIYYEIAAIKHESSTLDNKDVKLYLLKNNAEAMAPSNYVPLTEQSKIGSPVGSMVIDQGTINETSTNQYTLKMWMDAKAQLTDEQKSYTVTINVYASSQNPA